MASTEQPPVRTLPGARWSCRSTGHCCRSFDLGPVEPKTLAALEAADLPALWPAAREQPWYELRQLPSGEQAAWLTRRSGACIFLDDQQRCAIHALLGEPAKPAFCREFPFHMVAERTGLTVVVRNTCAGLHASCLDGAPLAPQAAALPDLPRAYPVARFEPTRVEILPGLGLDLDSWAGAEPAILNLVDAPDEQPEATVAQLRDALARATGRSLPQPDSERLDRAYAEAWTILAAAVTTLATAQAPQDDPRAALPGRARRWLEQALRDHPAVVPPLDPGARTYLNGQLRSLIFGKIFHRMGGLPRALGLLLLELRMARLVAGATTAGPLGAAALSDLLVPWWTLAAHGDVVEAIRVAAPQLESIFVHTRGAPPSPTLEPQ